MTATHLWRVWDAERAWLWAVLAAPWLLFPDQMPFTRVFVPAVIALPMTVSLVKGQRLWPKTPFSIPCLLLVAAALLGFLVSSFPDLSRPKFAGLVLGMLTLRALLLGATRRPRLYAAVGLGLYVVVGLGCLVAGLLATYVTNKYWNGHITDRIPHAILHFPGAGTDGFVNQNALGGTVLFFLPIVFGLCTRPSTLANAAKEARQRVPRLIGPFCRSYLATIGLFLLAVLLVGILLVSQSRTAWISAAVTLAILTAARWRLARLMLAVAIIIVLSIGAWNGSLTGTVLSSWNASVVGTPPVPGVPQVPWRVDLWVRAVRCIHDFPLTGVGLGTFRRVAPVRYPFSTPPLWDIVHAHNTFLQAAVDVGLGGLVAYMALLILATTMSWQIYRRSGVCVRSVILGLWGNLCAVHIFGLTDAIALGAKVGVFFWWNLGLIGCLHMFTVRPFVADGISDTRET